MDEGLGSHCFGMMCTNPPSIPFFVHLLHRVSHIGKNTGSGHYVAHIKRNGKWVIYNDEKVALSENPPLQHAYLYLFQRKDTIESPNPDF
jgi:ubiquitin carboxyl-terminal hydrolase 5/13